jgi:hypothetical protein
MPRALLYACVVVFAVIMLGVRFLAHGIADHFGTVGIYATLALMFAAAWLHDRRQRPRP